MTKPLAQMNVAELETEAALVSNRQLSLAMTRMAAAKRSLEVGDRETARQYLEASRTAWLRSQEDERGQLARVAAVQKVVEAKGAALDATAGKRVVRTAVQRAGAVWQESWARE